MKKLIAALSVIGVIFLVTSCVTDGWMRDRYIGEQHKIIGQVEVTKTYIHPLFIGASSIKKRTELQNMLLTKARQNYGSDAELLNINYESSWNGWSMLFYFSMMGFVEDAKATASVYDPVAEQKIETESAEIKRIESQKREEEEQLKQKQQKEKLDRFIITVKELYHSPIIISGLYTSRPNSANGVNISVSGINISEKPIKYITFTVVPYNRVDDIVEDQISGNSKKFCKITGPIGNDEIYSSEFENVWYNSTISYSEILSIEIIYMDNMKENITDKEVIKQLYIP